MSQRAGSFLAPEPMARKKVFRRKLPWRRDSKKNRSERVLAKEFLQQQSNVNGNRDIIEHKIQEYLMVNGMRQTIEEEMRLLLKHQHKFARSLAQEAKTVQLLDHLKSQGLVFWHIWQAACPDSDFIDVELGIDHAAEVLVDGRCVTLLINTKSSERGVREHYVAKRGWHRNILGFCPRLTEKNMAVEARRLYRDMLYFYNSRTSQNGKKIV